MDNGRIMKELKELQDGAKKSAGKEQVVEAKVIGDDLRHWKGKVFGPVSIPLIHQIFSLQ
jgi:ubiquitin-protein ligase